MESCNESFDNYYDKNRLYNYIKNNFQHSKLYGHESGYIGNMDSAKSESNTYYKIFLNCIKIKNLKQFFNYYNNFFKDNEDYVIQEHEFIKNLDKDNYEYDKYKYKYSSDTIKFIDNYIKFTQISDNSSSYGGSRKQLYNDFLNFLRINNLSVIYFLSLINNNESITYAKISAKIDDYLIWLFLFKSILEVYDIFQIKKGEPLSVFELKTKQTLINGYNADNKNNNVDLETQINRIIDLIKQEVNKNINRYLLTPYEKKQQQPRTQQPNHSQIIETKKNELKQKIEAIIGSKKISIDNIDNNNKLILDIKKQHKVKVENDMSIIQNFDQIIAKYPEYTKINSCMNPTDPIYLIQIHTNPDRYANLSKSNIDELEILLSEYNKLITQQKSTLTGITGGSHNLRHSIDLIIQSFKKQRPSLNINPDLLYNCILSSIKKNKNKPLRKYKKS